MGIQINDGPVDVHDRSGNPVGYGWGDSANGMEYWVVQSGLNMPFDFEFRMVPGFWPNNPPTNEVQILQHLLNQANHLGNVSVKKFSYRRQAGWISGPGTTFDIYDNKGTHVGVWTFKHEDGIYYREAACVLASTGQYPFDFQGEFRRLAVDPFAGITGKVNLSAAMAGHLNAGTVNHDILKVGIVP